MNALVRVVLHCCCPPFDFRCSSLFPRWSYARYAPPRYTLMVYLERRERKERADREPRRSSTLV